MTWQVAPFTVATARGRETVIAGWVSEPFALDFRAFDAAENGEEPEWVGGWTLTHLPTGYLVRRIFGRLVEAQAFADSLRHIDWSFTEPSKAKALSIAVKAAMDAMPDVEFFGSVSEIGPTQVFFR